MEKRELEFTTRLTREDVAGLVEALIEGLKDGRLKVQKSDDVLELDVPRVVDLKIEAEIDDERAEFEIEVSWMTNRADTDTVPDETPSGKPAKPAKKVAAGKTAAKRAPAKKAAAPRAAAAKNGTAPKKPSAAKKTGVKSGSKSEPDSDPKAGGQA